MISWLSLGHCLELSYLRPLCCGIFARKGSPKGMGGFEPFAFPHFRRQTSLNPRSSVKRVYFATDCLYQIAFYPGSRRRHQSDDIISSRLVRNLLFLSLLPFAYKYLLPLPPPTQPTLLSFLFSYTYQFFLLAQTSHSQGSFFSSCLCSHLLVLVDSCDSQ